MTENEFYVIYALFLRQRPERSSPEGTALRIDFSAEDGIRVEPSRLEMIDL